MDNRLLRGIFYEMEKESGKKFDGEDMTRSEVVEEMRDTKNLLYFLKLFGRVIEIETRDYYCGRESAILCRDCNDICNIEYDNCICRILNSITKDYNIAKCRIVCSIKLGCTTTKHILPGKFTKEEASRILDAYNKSEDTEYIYAIEECE